MPLKKVMTKYRIQQLTPDSLKKIVDVLMDKFELDAVDNVLASNEDELNTDEPTLGQFKYPYKHLLIWSVLLLRYVIL